MTDWNTSIIEDFRANDGNVGGQFEGASLILIYHTDAKSYSARDSHWLLPAVASRIPESDDADDSRAAAQQIPDAHRDRCTASPSVSKASGDPVTTGGAATTSTTAG
jgi:hypothetical protein